MKGEKNISKEKGAIENLTLSDWSLSRIVFSFLFLIKKTASKKS
jgi:hypothetical protein